MKKKSTKHGKRKMSYEHPKITKVDDWLYQEAYESIESHVLHWFKIESIEELYEDQIEEISKYAESLNEYSLTGYAYRQLIENWEYQ